jgi:hypothetical protein
MIKMAGIWDLGWNTPLKEAELWEYPLKDYGVDKLIMSPVSGIGITNNFIHECNDLGECVVTHRNQGVTIVFVDENGTETLDDFVHPENVLYVFGRASLSALTAYGTPADRSVKISTPSNLAFLWPHQAAVLVLDDRWKKSS